MDQILDKKSVFLRSEMSDFVVIIGDQRLNVHKSVLMSSSEYFSALFNSEMIETKTKEISLLETLIKPFLIVLKLSYDIVITDEEWYELKIQELFESIITANKYQFIECERQLSHKLMEMFAYKLSEVGDQLQENNSMLTSWELLEMAKLHNLMFLIDLSLKFFDENISYAFKTFDKQFISADILLDVIRRDTFGAPEVGIFMLVQKWIQKQRIRSNRKCIEETLLLDSVRLSLMSLEDLHEVVLKSDLYDSELIERIARHELNGDLAQNNRICYELGKMSTTNCSNDLHLRNDRIVSVFVNCVLPMPSKINHLMFNIRPTQPMDVGQQINANYWIGIADSLAENGFRKILDYTHESCIWEQDLYFDEPFVTDRIRIVLECSVDGQSVLDPVDAPIGLRGRPGAPPPAPGCTYSRSRRGRARFMTDSDPKLLNIYSITYECSKTPLKTIDSCVVPNYNSCQKLGAECYSPYLGHGFTVHLNDIILNNTAIKPNYSTMGWNVFRGSLDSPDALTLEYYENSMNRYYEKSGKKTSDSIEMRFQQLVESPIFDPNVYDRPNQYLIRLTQPIFADCLQFELVLENERSKQSDECLAAECKVEVCQTYSSDLDSLNWLAISSDSYLSESGFYNLEFELQKVSVVSISGFRYNSDKTVKYPLHLKNFSIPADRQSWFWTSGSKLGNDSLYTPINNDDWY